MYPCSHYWFMEFKCLHVRLKYLSNCSPTELIYSFNQLTSNWLIYQDGASLSCLERDESIL